MMFSINIDILGTFSFILAQNIDVFDGKIREVTPFLGYFRISGQLWDLGTLPCIFSQPLVPEERKIKVQWRGAEIFGAVRPFNFSIKPLYTVY